MVKKSKTALDSIAGGLGTCVADTALVMVKTLNYHWNMVGEEFYMYHKLLEEQYQDLLVGMDLLAERMRQLGFKAPGTMEEFIELSTLKEGDKFQSALDMVKELALDHEKMVENGKKIISFCDSEEDPGTADLLTERIRVHDKFSWLLKAHFQKK